MARSSFGGGAADYVENSVGTRLPGAITTFWSAQTGGTQYTDLIVSGGAATTVTAGVRGYLPLFSGPDVVAEMWADGGGGIRTRLVAPGLTQAVADTSYTKVTEGPLYPERYGAVGNGTTDDSAAFTAMLAALPAGGGSIVLPSPQYRLSTRILIDKPVDIQGRVAGIASPLIGTLLKFDAGVSGVWLKQPAQYSRISNMTLRGQGAGTADGLLIQSHATEANGLVIESFSRDGLAVDTSVAAGGGNANGSMLQRIRCLSNGRDGFRIAGTDSQAMTLNTCDATGNGGIGFNTIDSAHNLFLHCHCESNTGGAVTDGGSSSRYVLHYVEGVGNQAVNLTGAFLIWEGSGNYAEGVITKSASSRVFMRGYNFRSISIGDFGAGGNEYALSTGSYATGALSLSNQTGSKNIWTVDATSTRQLMLIPLDLGIATAGLKVATITTSATAGAATALPATPEGYASIVINGVMRKVAYYP